MKYCGIDLHSNNSVVVITDEGDKVLVSRRCANDLEIILALLKPHETELVGVVVESTSKLRDFVQGVDEIQPPLDPVEITLMNAVDAQVAGLALRPGFAAFADGDLHRPGFRAVDPLTAIERRLTQIVQLTVGDPDEPLVTGIAEEHEGALAELLGRRSGERPMERVQFGHGQAIGWGTAPDKGSRRLATSILQAALGAGTGRPAGSVVAGRSRRPGSGNA